MTFEPDGELDLIVAESLRDRAAHAAVHGRGMGDVRRRVRRRRQRQMAIGLVPAVAGVGWAVTRPMTHTPLAPSGEAGPCGEPATTWLGSSPTTTYPPDTAMWPSDVTVSTISFDANGNVVDPNGDPRGTTTTMEAPVTTDPTGDTVVPYTGPTAPPWTTTTLPTDGSVVELPTTAGDVSEPSVQSDTTLPAIDSTTTTICEPETVPEPTTVPVTTEAAASTTPTAIVGDLTSTKVQVANCSAENGVARMMTSALADVGFVLADPVSGTCDPKLDVSYVVYDESVPGAKDVAESLAGVLGGLLAEPGIFPIKVESGDWAEGSGVVLYLGNDLAGKTLSQIANPTTTIAHT